MNATHPENATPATGETVTGAQNILVSSTIRPRCRKCKRFISNRSCSTSGRLGDVGLGLCLCDRCLRRAEDAAFNAAVAERGLR